MEEKTTKWSRRLPRIRFLLLISKFEQLNLFCLGGAIVAQSWTFFRCQCVDLIGNHCQNDDDHMITASTWLYDDYMMIWWWSYDHHPHDRDFIRLKALHWVRFHLQRRELWKEFSLSLHQKWVMLNTFWCCWILNRFPIQQYVCWFLIHEYVCWWFWFYDFDDEWCYNYIMPLMTMPSLSKSA